MVETSPASTAHPVTPLTLPDVREYRISWEEFRLRCYCVVGFWLTIVIVTTTRADSPPFPLWMWLIVILAGCAFLFRARQVRVRLDRDGVHHRHWNGWRLWSWDDFTSGRVQTPTYFSQFEFSAQRPGMRRLRLGANGESLAIFLHSLLPKLELPANERVEMRLEWPKSGTLTITKSGIEYLRKGSLTFVPWSELELLRIWRRAENRPALSWFEVRWPGRRIELVGSGQWSGASALEVTAALTAWAPPDVLQDFVRQGPSRSAAEAEVRLQGLRESLNEMKWVRLFASVPTVGLTGYAIYSCWMQTHDWPILVAFSGGPFPLLVLGFSLEINRGRQRVRQLEAEYHAWRMREAESDN